MRMMRRMFSLFLAVCLLSSVCLTVLAWDLNDGDILIDFRPNQELVVTQHVTQGGISTPDSNPVITSNGKETSNTIKVESGADQTAQFTIQELNINTERTNSAIDIKDNSSAVITVQGAGNAVDNTTLGSGTNAATIHVGQNASLTIQGSDNPSSGGKNELLVNVEHLKYNITGAAGIGSNIEENFTGEINITGDVKVKAQSANEGAAIGSGSKGNYAGTINITNGANVHVEGSANSTGIGAGNSGDFTSAGAVNITDSTVYADTYSNGAAIGAGMKGDFGGKVTIKNSDVTAISGPGGSGEGAGIGAGYAGNFSGKVDITNSTVHAQATNGGAAIGSGGLDQNFLGPTVFSGEVNIHNSNVTAKTLDEGTPIGAPNEVDRGTSHGIFNGSVAVTGNSTLELIDGNNTELGEQVLVGGSNPSSSGSVVIDDTVTVNYWTGTRTGMELDGKTSVATQEDFAKIFKGAKVEVVIVPKASGSSKAVDTFWSELANKIREAKKGDEIVIDMQDRNSIPVYILELAAEYGVTLIIQWNGGEDIIVTPNQSIDTDAAYILLEALVSLLNM